jgi:hypothetical protein
MLRRVSVGLVVLTVAGAGVAYAATLNVGSKHLWAGGQTLTKASCTVTGAATDTFVNEASTSQTNGSTTTLDVIPDIGSRKYAYLQFDLSSCGVPTTGGADSATLSVYLANAPKSSFSLVLNRVTSSWSNSTTWSSQPTTAASASDTKPSGTTSGVWITFTVTADVDAFIKGALSSFGWRITESGTTQNATKDLAQFSSSDAASNKPQLVINYEK